jgi:hypothetical protein
MNEGCSTRGYDRSAYKISFGETEGRDHLDDIGVYVF